jgi:hypothetical protein
LRTVFRETFGSRAIPVEDHIHLRCCR